MISVIKTINFYIKWFHIIRKIKIKCFLFTLKAPELEKIFYFGLLTNFEAIFCVFEGINWFNKVSKVFSKRLRSKNEFKMDFGVAKTKTLFLQPP